MTFPHVQNRNKLREEAPPTHQSPPQVVASCECCGERQVCRLYPIGVNYPDGWAAESMAVCDPCRADHEALEATP